jgi:hypothetical protein
MPEILRAPVVSALIRRVTRTLKAFHFSVLLGPLRKESSRVVAERSGKDKHEGTQKLQGLAG